MVVLGVLASMAMGLATCAGDVRREAAGLRRADRLEERRDRPGVELTDGVSSEVGVPSLSFLSYRRTTEAVSDFFIN